MMPFAGRELAVTAAVTRKVVVRVGGQCDVRAGTLCEHRDGRRRRGELPSGERTGGSVAERAPGGFPRPTVIDM
jgi:hypothetical protein